MYIYVCVSSISSIYLRYINVVYIHIYILLFRQHDLDCDPGSIRNTVLEHLFPTGQSFSIVRNGLGPPGDAMHPLCEDPPRFDDIYKPRPGGSRSGTNATGHALNGHIRSAFAVPVYAL